MQIKYGLIDTDSHGQLDKDNWLRRMPKKWGDAIPQLRTTDKREHMAVDWGDKEVERWFINGKIAGDRGVVNCPAVMLGDRWGEAGEHRKYFPQRWSDVPKNVYDPIERLKALDADGVDAEVLFVNDPLQSGTAFQGTAEFEMDVVRAYNDGVAEWTQVSDRYIPLVMLAYLSGVEATVSEVARCLKMGHKGVNMLAEPSLAGKGLPHFGDRTWDPLWAFCQDASIPIHWHTGGGISLEAEYWKGYTRNEVQAMHSASAFSVIGQFIPVAMFSGVIDRFPRLQWVLAESGLGWVNYTLEGLDHEWERRRLWTQGVTTRPSEIFHRQFFAEFWFERAGIEQRHKIAINHIMWESDYPHSTSTWPESRKFVERSMAGVPKDERDLMLWQNAARLYQVKAVDVREKLVP